MAARSARRSGRSSRRRVSRPEATTSHTDAGTPDAAPVRCGTKPTRCQSSNVVERRAEQPDRARRSAGSSPVSARTRVDLPEPLAPSSATNSPGCDGQVDAAQDGPAADGDRAVRTHDDGAPGRSFGRHPFAFSQGREVLAHQGQVVLVGGLVAQPLDRVEHGGA